MSRSQIKEAHQRVADSSGIPPVPVPAEWVRWRIAEAKKDNAVSKALVPLGLTAGKAVWSRGVKFLVLPKIANVVRMTAAMGRRHQPGGVALASKTGESMDLLGVRPYRPGDPVRVTTLAAPAPATDPAASAAAGSVLISGLGASPGVATGRVRVLRSPAEGEQLQTGEMLVAPMTSPDWVPTLRRAAGIITDSGGMTCHAAIVSRELRIPCVVGTRDATRMLRDGELVTIDGRRGQVLARTIGRGRGRGQ